MFILNGHPIYEAMPAHCIDLDHCSVSTLDSWIEDSAWMSDMDIPPVIDAGTVAGIAYAVTDRSIGIPDVILDVPRITRDVLETIWAVLP